jgi:hypothetical protein
MRLIRAVLLGIAGGALYTVSPLTAWCVALAAIVLTLAGRGLPASQRRALNVVLAAALIARLAAIGALFVINTPMHDDESVGMLSGDEAYGLSRALRTRDVITGVPVTQYDYFVASDEYGRNSYITALTGIQVLFGPTPYSMRLLNMLLFTAGAVLLFRTTRSAFGPLPAFGGLAVLMFLPTLFLWSISLLKEPLYLFGTTLVIAGAIAAAGAANWRARALPSLAVLAGLAIIRNLRPGAFALAVLGIACGIAGLVFFSLSLRARLTVATAAAVAVLAIASQPSAQRRLTSALETTAKTHAGHVFTVGHSYKLLDEGFYVNPVPAVESTLTLTAGEAARYAVRAAVSIVAVPWPWQLASSRELSYLPEQLFWYVIVALLTVGLVAGWRRDPLVTSLLAGYTLPTAAALALTNGNVGTLLRLRGMIIPYLIWLSAVGFCAALQRVAPKAATT